MPDPSDQPHRTTRGVIGLVVCRVLLPAWVLTGALFKLVESNPGLLPREMLGDADRLGINLDVLLATLIALELLIVAVLLFVGRLARPTAIFITSVFCAVLIREIVAGNTSCGCLGASSPSPLVMLVIDGVLLLCAIFLKPAPIPAIDHKRWPLAVAGALALAAGATSFAAIVPRGDAPLPKPHDPGPGSEIGSKPVLPVAAPASTGPAACPDLPALVPMPLPSYWFESDFAAWNGTWWTETDLLRFLAADPPSNMDAPVKYVIFYSRTCDHCEDMFKQDFAPNPDLAAMVTAVEVPAASDQLRSPDAWPMPETAVEHRELPLGPDWVMTTPIALRIENCVVVCAAEGDHRECLGLE